MKVGVSDKIQLFVTDNQNNLNRYVLIDANLDFREFQSKILSETGKHGNRVLLASNGKFDSKMLIPLQNNLKHCGITLLDAFTIKQINSVVANYISAAENGMLNESIEKYNGVNSLKDLDRRKKILEYSCKTTTSLSTLIHLEAELNIINEKIKNIEKKTNESIVKNNLKGTFSKEEIPVEQLKVAGIKMSDLSQTDIKNLLQGKDSKEFTIINSTNGEKTNGKFSLVRNYETGKVNVNFNFTEQQNLRKIKF